MGVSISISSVFAYLLFILICIDDFMESFKKNVTTQEEMEIRFFINFPFFCQSTEITEYAIYGQQIMNGSLFTFFQFFSHSGKQAKHLSCNLKQVLVQPIMPSTHIFLHLRNSSSVPSALIWEQSAHFPHCKWQLVSKIEPSNS